MSHFHSVWDRVKAHLEAWFVDHELLRVIYRNFFKLSPNAYRSNHPSPAFIRKMQRKHGLKTIISLRAANKSGPYRLEKEACDQLGIELVNHNMSSRSLPKVEQVLKAKELLENAEYPILIHCKSGADRAGLMSVFYKLFIAKEPIEEALKQLSMKYGHFRWAETGKLDFFFDEYLRFAKLHPETDFLDWVQNHYDREELDRRFKSDGWANIVVNRILRRE
ncbi:tyrosine-protein phosphatase [Thiomicrorhabdus sp.]|uniref:fused DSP-PTPase phosphatase/NAD kinase-like protein n=1 Tax=Thiomicrorhabdus sp. TaxID=2039724 RepID=UPI0029C78823|nr:tyrosine-protein phosphatase [Thiomicrorhabdus sp.]